MDAHYTYKSELSQVLEARGDYIAGIKGNQGTLDMEIENYFTQAHAISYDSKEFACYAKVNKGPGKLETKSVCVSCDLE